MYVVKQTCKKCGRDSKFPSTATTRTCPLCFPNATRSVERIPRTKEAPRVK